MEPGSQTLKVVLELMDKNEPFIIRKMKHGPRLFLTEPAPRVLVGLKHGIKMGYIWSLDLVVLHQHQLLSSSNQALVISGV